MGYSISQYVEISCILANSFNTLSILQECMADLQKQVNGLNTKQQGLSSKVAELEDVVRSHRSYLQIYVHLFTFTRYCTAYVYMFIYIYTCMYVYVYIYM